MPNSERLNTFEGELTELINKHSIEGLSNTPDFILAFYLKDCLVAWQNAQTRRTEWYRKKTEERIIKDMESRKDKEEKDRPSQLGSLE